METGNYNVNDPLIREIDKKIATLSWFYLLFYYFILYEFVEFNNIRSDKKTYVKDLKISRM